MTETSIVPLVVDLDGTLTPTDTLVESIIQLGKQHPVDLLKLPFWLLKGRAEFKANIANRLTLKASNLPYRVELIDYLRHEKQNGRPLILATAANSSIADAVAAHLDLFDTVLASSENLNLKGSAKLAAIQETVGTDFVYAGDSKADLPIWQAAQAAILVNTSRNVGDTVRKNTPIELEIPAVKIDIKLWLRAMRVHQWFKNLLLFVPLLTAFSFQDVDKLLAISLAFFAFSFTASATYMGNDLWDLDSDRTHPRKKHRPFASAQIPILKGITVAAILLTLGLALAIKVSLNFFWMLLLYLVITTTYTWIFKTYVLIDVIVLSLLYTLRIIAGSVAMNIPASSWLLAFSVFIFFSLALVKRCAELLTLQQSGRETTNGRDYRTTDLAVLWPLGIGAALSAVVVFGLFISAPETQVRYASPQGLWLVAIGLIYWLARLWIKTARGEMHDDPLVFAIRDFGSRLTIMAMIAITLAAHFTTLD
ncbi:MAG: UbiA family prenyltransferase [Methylococcaceae bacterium]|jgi:4-hydroxybenzoate polyprenyltransferase/phosphoglycolate phosphatase-like HAD superfamily hydrolase|nr:UbiA family prenyltransferase [Methylococcaceae bacterium]MDZ4156999.1 UbiA family prenyltransferase [Methylococcales bacterium]MDP2392719.1 UbiA family prenyltransferase [Methylococcaceae bacterium]MDP3018584.1 UbiA family prenyltransferase [Methylococcaceae bacterium]MDP3391339.1 UbiA family prenyltransferase [Methylococcaceae bacterium]